MAWGIVYTKQAQSDADRLLKAGFKQKALIILGILEQNPFQNPPPYEKLVGDLAGFYSRRINIQHRHSSPDSKAPALQIQGLGVSYPSEEKLALKDFDISVPAGSSVALVGP